MRCFWFAIFQLFPACSVLAQADSALSRRRTNAEMKIFLNQCAAEWGRLVLSDTAYIYNPATAFNLSETRELTESLRMIDDTAGYKLKIYVHDSAEIKLQPDRFEDFSLFVAASVPSAPSDSLMSVLIFSPGLHKIRIQNSRKMQYWYTDNETKRIIDYIIIPQLKIGNNLTGFKESFPVIIREIRNDNHWRRP